MVCELATDHVSIGILVPLEHAYIMNTPAPHQNSGFIQKSRRNVHAQVVTLERVQQTCPVPFNVSRVVKQQHPRFNGHDSSLLPLEPFQVEVEGMRGVLESCWEISAPATATIQAPAVQTSSIRQAQLQRFKRNRGELICTHAASNAAASAEQQPKPRSKGNSSRTSSAESATAAGQHVVLGRRAKAFDEQHTQQLQILMDLWHIYTTDPGFAGSRKFVYRWGFRWLYWYSRRGHARQQAPLTPYANCNNLPGNSQHKLTWATCLSLLKNQFLPATCCFSTLCPLPCLLVTVSNTSITSTLHSAVQLLPEPPRLLTAAEEQALGSIIQQHRKLQQLWQEHPDVAAAAFGDSSDSTSASSSDTTTTSSNTTSSSSSTKGGPKGDKRFKWPPALTPADIREVSQLPAGWRSMLPVLAGQASKLMVAFNTG